jgi:putative ABC transport system permease protein
MSFLLDLRHALRTLRRSPGYVVVAVLCLGLGVGATTTIFSVVNGMLLRPLGFREPDRLVRLFEVDVKSGGRMDAVSAANMLDVSERTRVFDGPVALYGDVSFAMGGDGEGEAQAIDGQQVSWNVFQTLGIAPAMGRTFRAEDGLWGRNRVAIVGWALWQRALGGASDVVGRSIRLDGVAYTVVGVMPPRMGFPDNAEVWTPLAFETPPNRGAHQWYAVARLRDGVTVAQAAAEVRGVMRALEREYPDFNTGLHGTAMRYHEYLVAEFGTTLWTMLGAVGFVLLIACANVANLQLARASGRLREMAVRTAIGAARARLVRQLLTESLVVAVLGGALGLLFSVWWIDLLVRRLPFWMSYDLDWRVLAFTVASTLATVCLFGLVPALRTTRLTLHETLKDGGRGSTAGARHQRTQGGLVVGQLALCLMLLAGATLMMRSFVRMQRADTGFRTAGVLTMQLQLPVASYGSAARRIGAIDAIVRGARAIPGVTHVAAVSSLPLSGSNSSSSLEIEGVPVVPGEEFQAEHKTVAGDFFRALDIPIRRGRGFLDRELVDSTHAVVVNERFAELAWPGRDPIGRRVRYGDGAPWLTVVGVVPTLRMRRIGDRPRPQFWVPYGEAPRRAMTLVVRGAGDPASLAAPLREVVRRVDPIIPLFGVETLEAVRARSMWQSRVFGGMFAAFGIAALLLASIGLYGVIAYGVAQRTHEIGIRMALGARAADVVRLVVRHGATLAATGILAGLLLAALATRALRGMLFEVSALDPVTFLAMPVVLAAVALLASWLPARRATRVDPVMALRSE